jgi:hypothetical protein
MVNEETAHAVDMVFSTLVRSMKSHGKKNLTSEDLNTLANMAMNDKKTDVSAGDKKVVQFVLQALSTSMKEFEENSITIPQLEALLKINKEIK